MSFYSQIQKDQYFYFDSVHVNIIFTIYLVYFITHSILKMSQMSRSNKMVQLRIINLLNLGVYKHFIYICQNSINRRNFYFCENKLFDTKYLTKVICCRYCVMQCICSNLYLLPLHTVNQGNFMYCTFRKIKNLNYITNINMIRHSSMYMLCH